MPTSDKIYEKLKDRNWRLNNLYCIIPEAPVDGKTVIQFKLREAQKELLENLHNRIIINKCRKIGYSTLLALLCLDSVLFNSNFRASVIDYKEQSAYDKLDMLRNAWHLSETHISDPAIKEIWKGIKNRIKLLSESKSELKFSNGSIFQASTTSMGASPNLLWISELGPLSVSQPDRAAKIKRGSINSVAPDSTLIIESTAEGSHGVFFDLLTLALESKNKTKLEKGEYKLLFKPWFLHPSYKTVGDYSKISAECHQYYDMLLKQHNIMLSDEQKLWYHYKKKEIGEDVYSQYPSIFEESIKSSTSGAIYPGIINIRSGNRITELDYESDYPLYCSWDLGVRDATCGILFQFAGRDLLIHRSFSTTGEGASTVAKQILNWEKEFNSPISKIFLPHDAGRRDIGSGKPYIQYLYEKGIPQSQTTILPVCSSVWNGIRTARELLNKAWFDISCNERFRGEDGESLPSLIQCLENYKKNGKSGQPQHDIYSNFADAFRYIAEATENSFISSAPISIYSSQTRRPSSVKHILKY